MAIDTSPSGNSLPVTTSDTVAQPAGRALYVGVSGDIVGRLVDDPTDRTFKAVPVGVLPCRFALIKTTGTTATNMLILF